MATEGPPKHQSPGTSAGTTGGKPSKKRWVLAGWATFKEQAFQEGWKGVWCVRLYHALHRVPTAKDTFPALYNGGQAWAQTRALSYFNSLSKSFSSFLTGFKKES